MLAWRACLARFDGFADEETIWSFSPLVDLSLYRWVRRLLRRPQLDRQIFFAAAVDGDAAGYE